MRPERLDALLTRLAAIADAQHGAILGQQARKLVGASALATAEHSGAVVKLWHGAYAIPPVSLQTRLRAADLTLGSPQVPCLDSASALYGFDISTDRRLHLLSERDSTSKRSEIVLHRIEPISPMMRYQGRLLMGAAETAVRVAARQRTDPEALAVLDAALASRAVAGAGQFAALVDSLSINGIQRVRRVAGWADPMPESPRESWLRWVFLDAGLPAPTVQFWVRISGRRYRLDLAWPEFKVACEYDGTEFHTGDALYRDRRRLNDLLADQWLMCFATNQMVTADRPWLVGQVGDMLRSRGARL